MNQIQRMLFKASEKKTPEQIMFMSTVSSEYALMETDKHVVR